MPENNIISHREENLITVLMNKYLPFWPLFAVLLIVGLVGAWSYLHYATPIYEASATLIIKDENKGVDDSKIMESMNVFTSKKIVENEIEVIQSRALMNQVVNELGLYAPVFEDRGIRSSSAYTTTPVIVKLMNPEILSKGTAESPKIYFSYDSLKQEVKINNTRYPVDKWVKTHHGTLKFLMNSKQSDNAADSLYFTLVNTKLVTGDLLDRLEVSAANKLSTVVNLKLTDPVPQRGEDILNQLIYIYNEAAVSDRNTLAANTLAFIEDRIKYVENDLDEVESEVQQYKSTEGVVDLSEQGKLYLQNVGDNDRRIADVNLQLAVLDKVEKYVISKDHMTGIVPSTLGIDDPVLSQLLERLYDSEIEYEKLRKTIAQNNPILVSVANEISKIRPSILENVRNQRVNLKASLTNLGSVSGKYTSVLQTIPQKERELLELSRRKIVKSNLFSFLLQKREEAALSYAPTTGYSKVVDKAESSILPIAPKKYFVYLVGIVIALGISISTITGKELLTRKILFRAEIEDYTAFPIIGELAFINKKSKSLINESQNVFIADQFRHLQAALGLFSKSNNKKKLMVTSSVPGEGKSYVSVNLSLSLSYTGKKVILLDMDLRNSRVSSVFNLSKSEGVTEYLIGESSISNIIMPAEYSNLYVIPAGRKSLNSSELLSGRELEILFITLEKEFDYIVVDTPPVALVSDAIRISEFCDKVLFLIRHDYTPKSIIKYMDKDSRIKLLKNASIVFNGIKPRGYAQKNYGYGYGHEHMREHQFIK